MPGHADPAPPAVQHGLLSLQHLDTAVLEDRRDLVGLFVVVVVVAQDRHHRHPQVLDLPRHHPGLLGSAVPGQVAREEQDVGTVGQGLERGPQHSLAVGAHVDVTDGCDADHASSSAWSGDDASATTRSQRTVSPVSVSPTIRPISSRQCDDGTVPVTSTESPCTATCTPSSASGPPARRSRRWATR
ncbi:hypothetical protein SGLAM104S_04829 [Streptomyces glaucescens]